MEATLEAVIRTAAGKNEVRRLRRAGRVPAVLYGSAGSERQSPALALAVDPKAVLRILHSDSGVNTLIALSVDGGGHTRVMVKEYQLDPIEHALLHVDFYRVAMDRVVRVTVPVVLKGEAKGVKQQGGIVDFVHRDVEGECLPGDVPEHIEVDVSELMVGQGVRVRDLAPDARWKPLSDADMLIVHVVMPKAEEVAEPAAAEAVVAAVPAEPEIIKKGKAEKAEEEAE